MFMTVNQRVLGSSHGVPRDAWKYVEKVDSKT